MTSASPFGPPLIDSSSALFLDFDGTLAEIQDTPGSVVLPAPAHALLLTLHDRLDGALAVVSGRDLRDLALRVPDRIWRVGGHGLEICRPGIAPGAQPSAPPGLLAAIDEAAARHPGVWVEKKGPVFAVHYRAAPELGPALIETLTPIVAREDGYRLLSGKLVLDIKPPGADKGAALASLMQHEPFRGRTPVMVGDDATDEDGFAAARTAGGFGVKVGDGATAATFRLASVAAVWRWLDAREAA